jgi:two-component system phosphate regulon response regulator PhoB
MFGLKKKGKGIILLVEDDALLLEVLKLQIESEGFQVKTAVNGLDVLELARKFVPNLILLDLIIPGIDGFAVLKELKADEKLVKIPVIVLSNLDKESDIKSTIALGAVEHIVKADVKVEYILKVIKRNI